MTARKVSSTEVKTTVDSVSEELLASFCLQLMLVVVVAAEGPIRGEFQEGESTEGGGASKFDTPSSSRLLREQHLDLFSEAFFFLLKP